MCSHYVAWATHRLSLSRSLHCSMEDSPNLFEKLPPRRANTLPSSFRLESVSRPIRISINNIARLPSPVRFQESLARRRRSLARPPLILENTSDNSDIAAAANERGRGSTLSFYALHPLPRRRGQQQGQGEASERIPSSSFLATTASHLAPPRRGERAPGTHEAREKDRRTYRSVPSKREDGAGICEEERFVCHS